MPAAATAGRATMSGGRFGRRGGGIPDTARAVNGRCRHFLLHFAATSRTRGRGIADLVHGGEILRARYALVIVSWHGFSSAARKVERWVEALGGPRPGPVPSRRQEPFILVPKRAQWAAPAVCLALSLLRRPTRNSSARSQNGFTVARNTMANRKSTGISLTHRK